MLLEAVSRLDPARSCWVSGEEAVDARVDTRGESDRAVPIVACACAPVAASDSGCSGVADAVVDVAVGLTLKLSHVGRWTNFPRDWG